VDEQPTADVLADDAEARWRYLVARREAVIGAIRQRTGDTGEYWSRRVAAMGGQVRVEPGRIAPPLDRILAGVGRETTVLDVGAGWGRFAIPLAQAARQVVAVEPSGALVPILRENAAAAGVSENRLRIVEAGWQEAEVSPADVVLCANVLTPLAEIGPFIRKLDAHTLRRCYIVLRATAMDAPLEELWQAIHGVPYPRETTHADAYAVLDALGIPAEVAILPAPFGPWDFDSRVAVARYARERLWLGLVGQDPRADAQVEAWLDAALVRDGERWRVPAPVPRMALIWWDKEVASGS
jgi:SAM-dependent methyltransferase